MSGHPSFGKVPITTFWEAVNAPGYGQCVEIVQRDVPEFFRSSDLQGLDQTEYNVEVVGEIIVKGYVEVNARSRAEAMWKAKDRIFDPQDPIYDEIWWDRSNCDPDPDPVEVTAAQEMDLG